MAKYGRPALKRFIHDKMLILYEEINTLKDIKSYTELNFNDTIKLAELEAELNLIKEIAEIAQI